MARLTIALLISSLWVSGCGGGPSQTPIDPAGPRFEEPIFEYGHDQGNSITGGFVYRGTALPELVGSYVYGDFGSGRIWSLRHEGTSTTNTLLVDTSILISTFGLSLEKEILVAAYGSSRRIQRLEGRFENGEWNYDLVEAFRPAFDHVVDLRSAGDSRLFVVEQAGRILVLDPSTPDAPTTFLDLREVVTSGGELGLLGLAFPPDYLTRRQFFVYYTVGGGPWTVRLCRFGLTADPDVADPSTEVLLLSIEERFANHNGGALAFDGSGHLLVGVGDEGGGGDPNDNAQDGSDLHGTILRLDIDRDTPPYYRIPADNPFVDASSSFAPEIYAYGLRNPWRVSYDPTTDRIWAADVGQNRWEEINWIRSGANYGWDCREGFHPYEGPPDGPAPACAE